MHYLNRVQKGIEYIEANLDFDISLSQVAVEAGLSQWHFQRIFKALTNETLKTYIRSRRLANSLDKLLHSELKIIDIALTSGYQNQESFTRAFKASFQIPPSEYRKLGDKSLFLRKLEFNTQYLRHINQNLSLKPAIITCKPMILVGLKTQFYSVDSEKNNISETLPKLWADFQSRAHEIMHAIAGNFYGVVQQIKNDTDRLEYYAAVEVTNHENIPAGMASIEIKATQYASFVHRGEAQHINNTVNYIYSSWLLNSDRIHTGGPDLESYGAKYHPTSASSEIAYAIPLKL